MVAAALAVRCYVLQLYYMIAFVLYIEMCMRLLEMYVLIYIFGFITKFTLKRCYLTRAPVPNVYLNHINFKNKKIKIA